MFTPKNEHIEDLEVIKKLMIDCPLATVIVATVSGIEACHIPLYWEDDGSEFGILVGHIAKQNPIHTLEAINNQWTVIFQDAGHYISPNWYLKKTIDHKVVPTWNYRSVHFTVVPTIITDPKDLELMVGKLTDLLEKDQEEPWAITDAPPLFLAGMYRGIIGFKLEILEMTSRFKLSQHKSDLEKDNISTHLSELDTDAAARMANLIIE